VTGGAAGQGGTASNLPTDLQIDIQCTFGSAGASPYQKLFRTTGSWKQQQLSSGLATLQIAVRLSRLSQGKRALHPQLERARHDRLEDLRRSV
jgi:hypothetical protein